MRPCERFPPWLLPRCRSSWFLSPGTTCWRLDWAELLLFAPLAPGFHKSLFLSLNGAMWTTDAKWTSRSYYRNLWEVHIYLEERGGAWELPGADCLHTHHPPKNKPTSETLQNSSQLKVGLDPFSSFKHNKNNELVCKDVFLRLYVLNSWRMIIHIKHTKKSDWVEAQTTP